MGMLFESDEHAAGPTEQIIRQELDRLARGSGGPVPELVTRYARRDPARVAAIARELASGPEALSLIITNGLAAWPVLDAVADVPVVVIGLADQVLAGVQKRGHRSRVTGLNLMIDELDIKRLDLLAQCLRPGSRVACLAPPRKRDLPTMAAFSRHGAGLGLQLQVLYAISAEEIQTAIEQASRGQAVAVFQMGDQILYSQRRLIADAALALRLPTMMEWPEAVHDGATLGYGVNRKLVFNRLTHIAWRVGQGEPPERIPVERPTQVTLAVHLRRARQMGFSLPAEVLARADEVIE